MILAFFCNFQYLLLRESRFWSFKASIGYFRPRSPLRYYFFFKISILDLIHAQNYEFLANKNLNSQGHGLRPWPKAMAFGHGPRPWPSAMAYGHGLRPWP